MLLMLLCCDVERTKTEETYLFTQALTADEIQVLIDLNFQLTYSILPNIHIFLFLQLLEDVQVYRAELPQDCDQ